MGFSVIHSYYPEVLEMEIEEFGVDLALEWQHSPDDYPIRDLLRKCKKEVPFFLSLNWNGSIPPNFSNLGYHDYLNVPWEIGELMSKFYEVLPESKKPILKDLWEKMKKRGEEMTERPLLIFLLRRGKYKLKCPYCERSFGPVGLDLGKHSVGCPECKKTFEIEIIKRERNFQRNKG